MLLEFFVGILLLILGFWTLQFVFDADIEDAFPYLLCLTPCFVLGMKEAIEGFEPGGNALVQLFQLWMAFMIAMPLGIFRMGEFVVDLF